MIGWNGVKRAKTSNRVQYPLLQDVNIGWLEKIRQDAPDHVMSNITDEAGKVISETIRVGEGGDFNNLDALVIDTVNNAIDPEYQDDTELMVICGRELLADKYFPPKALLISRLDNLSIYYQEGTRRRSVLDNPKRDRIENYESVNEAYVVEDYRGVALIENIEMLAASKKAASLQPDNAASEHNTDN